MNSLRRALYLRTTPELIASIHSGGSAAYYSGVAHAAADLPASVSMESELAKVEVKDQLHASKLRKALEIPVTHAASAHEASPSESQSLIEIFRLHNSSLKVAGGHMIKARVIEVDKKKITLDTGMKLAKISVSDITPECILKRANTPKSPPRVKGEVRPGDLVQVYLEHEETPEGDMLVSGQQAAVQKRVKAVWRELQSRMQEGRPVKGRILNAVSGGYAVGVGGLVCFVPNSQLTKASARRIGELQDFRVVQMTPSRSNVVLEDNRLHLGWEKLQINQAKIYNDSKRKADSRKLVRDVVIEAAGLQHELSSGGAEKTVKQQPQQPQKHQEPSQAVEGSASERV